MDQEQITGVRLEQDDTGLYLTDGKLRFQGDFSQMLPRVKQGRLSGEMLVKAAKLKKREGEELPLAIDATAGMGEDSFLLAAAGFRVILMEYNPVIARLLTDARDRGLSDPALAPILSRMEIRQGDSILAMKEMARQEGFRPDLIYLDPMFPERQKSGLIKKKFQLIHQLESPCSVEEDMLSAAMALRPRKLVIKRPLKGALLSGVKPDYSLSGKAIRYDCIVFA